jgi:acyl-CoA reductase-like NAD-dependent aldehyde dehydrogenase
MTSHAPVSESGVAKLKRYQLYIGGEWVRPVSGEYFESLDPRTGDPWYEAARARAADVDCAVTAARRAFETWRNVTPTQRGRHVQRLGELIAAHADELARAESHDNGKLLREMRGQLAMLPEYFYYFAGLADKIEGRLIPNLRPEILNYTLREPLGVVGAITPWNSPLLLSAFKLAPALISGNTVVIKPSEHTSASVLQLAPLFEEAGLPPGTVNIVTGYGDEAGAALAAHGGVAKVAFTGGTETGRAIARLAAERFAPVTLELGGKSPNIVFEDADLENATVGVIAGIFAAAGQTCVAGSRIFLHEAIYDAVLEQVVKRARSIKIGDPLDETTELGPLAFEEHRARVEAFVSQAVNEGAQVVVGGKRPSTPERGWYLEPTVLVGVTNAARVAQDEIFGPVATVLRFSSEDEVVRLANECRYGLAAGVWTHNLSRAHRLAARLEAGTVWVNTYRSLAPMSPFGGFKDSGLGKENGVDAVLEYTRVKSVWVNTSEEPMADPFVLR